MAERHRGMPRGFVGAFALLSLIGAGAIGYAAASGRRPSAELVHMAGKLEFFATNEFVFDRTDLSRFASSPLCSRSGVQSR